MLYQKPWFRRNDKSGHWRHAKRPERRGYPEYAAVCTKYRSASCQRYGCCSEQTGITRHASRTDWHNEGQ
ncbi:hypothetical protein DO493_20290 [Salmonella enterica]|nr:hypothetical protein [Salmonella enterica]